MSIRLAVVMDPIESIHYHKDSTLAMLWAAQKKDWSIHYITKDNIYSKNGDAYVYACELDVYENEKQWFKKGVYQEEALSDFDIVLMRLDPPYNMEYIYITHLLELAQAKGTLVSNNPLSLRLVSEKLSTNLFPELTPLSIVSQSQNRLRNFLNEHKDIIVKPLDGMGGSGIFRVQENDKNAGVILETMTQLDQRQVIAQKFIPEIKQGDKRILMINGEAIPYALARIPAANENRGNLAAGGTGKGVELSDNDKRICERLGLWLREKNIHFAGLDVIGNYLTEINVTCPTCIRQLDAQYDLDIASQYLDFLEKKLAVNNY